MYSSIYLKTKYCQQRARRALSLLNQENIEKHVRPSGSQPTRYMYVYTSAASWITHNAFRGPATVTNNGWPRKRIVCNVARYVSACIQFNRQCLIVQINCSRYSVQWNLVIKRSDITKPSYNKVILLVPALYISLFFYPDIMRNLI